MSKRIRACAARFLVPAIAFLAFVTVYTLEADAQVNVSFESPTYTLGNINGQDGWTKTGPFDVAVSSSFGTTGFGAQSLRISNSVTSGSFGDQTFSKALYNEAGEASATNGGYSGGVRMSHFEAQYSLASKIPGAQQPGLLMSNSADRGDGARMTYLRFEDQANGIHVFFDDYVDAAPFGGANGDPVGCGAEDNFIETDIATLDRTTPHVIKVVVDFVAGPRNDVVRVYIDGILVKTGTTWEDYFRYCAEQSADNNTHTVDSLLFRTAGTAVPANAGNGFLVDNLTLTSGPAANIVNVGAGSLTNTPNYTQWFWWNDETDAIDNSLGSFVTGPGTAPIGTGSAQTSVTGTQRRNMATYQFAATPLSTIGTLRFSTYNPSAGNGGSPNRSGYLNFNVDFTGVSSSFQRRLVYIPSQNGTVIQNQWQEWDAINGGAALWSYSGPTWPSGIGGGGEPGTTLKTWNQVLSQYPSIRVNPVDSWMGIRVGEPYADGYTENIDKFIFGTTTNLTIFNFDPLPPVVYVDDDWAGTPGGTDPDGAGPATSFGYDAFATVQGGIDGVDGGGTVHVAAGTYVESLVLSKSGISLLGSGVDSSIVIGPYNAGGNDTLLINGSNNIVDGFTITRNGNTAATWLANVKNQGINLAAPGGGNTIRNSKLTGNRNAIYVGQSCNNNTIRRNIIDSNRTGVHMVDNNGPNLVEENFITNNWTMGVLFRSEGGTEGLATVRNNNITANWYSEAEYRDSNVGGLQDLSDNHLGSTITRTTTPSGEPGYASQIPSFFPGGSAVPPPTHPQIAGVKSAQVDYSPYLTSSADASPGTPGFQGDHSSLVVTADAAQVGAASRIQEGINLVSSTGSLTIGNGSYPGNVNVNKPLNIRGNFTVGGSFDVTVAGAHVRPGSSPGIINTGNLSLVAGSAVDIEVNGTNVGSQYDQLNVTGTVSLGGASLNMTLGYVPTAGHTYTIINNDGSDAVTGTFAGLPEATVFYVGSHSFRISYVGGTGNDVTLTSVVLCSAVSIPTNIQSQTATTVNVPVNVDDTTGKGLYSTDFTLTYNSSVISAPVVSLGTVTAGSVLTVNTTTPGTIVISIFNTTPFAGTGTLANVLFTVNGLPGSSSPVTFSAFKFNEGTQCLSTSNGLVTVIGGTITGTVTYGNALVGPAPPRYVPNATITGTGPTTVSATTNSSGAYSLSGFVAGNYTRSASKSGGFDINAITSFDASRVARHVVGIEPFIGVNQPIVADVSGTGGVTSFDASLIARFVAGLPGAGSTGNWIFTPGQYGPSTVYSNISGEDYTALLMGEVTGNWGDPSSFGPLVGGAKPAKLSMSPTTAEPGSRVTVPVAINGVANRGVTAYQFNILYDPRVLRPAATPVSIDDTVSSGYIATVNAEELGRLRVVVFGTMPIEANGTLIKLMFNAVGRPGLTTALAWENVMLNEGTPSVVFADGYVKIGPSLSSDMLTGRVLTATGDAVAGAEVTAIDTEGVSRVTVSDDTGVFRFADVKVGQTYTIMVNADGLKFTPMTVSMSSDTPSIDIIAHQ